MYGITVFLIIAGSFLLIFIFARRAKQRTVSIDGQQKRRLSGWEIALLAFGALSILSSMLDEPAAPSIVQNTPSESAPTETPIAAPVTAAKEPATTPMVTAAGNPQKVFTEADVYLDSSNRMYKTLIVKAINKVYQENERCASYQGADISVTQKGTKANPMFYVSCNDKDGSPFNVFISKSEIESDKQLTAPQHVNQTSALAACKQAAMEQLNYPSTANFSIFGSRITEFPNGRTRVAIDFKAKNGFGLELKHVATCLLDADKIHDVIITENK